VSYAKYDAEPELATQILTVAEVEDVFVAITDDIDPRTAL